jgi:hypothetical protein
VVPGSILTATGVLLTARAAGLIELIGRWWPLVLVLIGIWMLLQKEAEPPADPPQLSTPPANLSGRATP